MRTETPMIRRIVPVYRCVLGSVWRDKPKMWVLGVTCLGVVGMTVGFRLGLYDWRVSGIQYLHSVGVGLLLPICALLVSANGVYSEMRSEGTLVYLWLRPVSPALSVAGGWFAAMAAPFIWVVVPITVGGWVLEESMFLPALVALVAYSSIFLALGMVLRRPMFLGLIYIVVWEGVIGALGQRLGRMTILHYVRSISAESEDLDFGAAVTLEKSFGVSILVPLCVALAFYLLAVWRYRRMEVP